MVQRCQVQFESNFHVIASNDRSQAAVMALAAGDSTGGPDNRHNDSDQWLYVSGGKGEAIVSGQSYKLSPGVLLLIERGETHEIRNTGDAPLNTINIYVPPAYPDEEGPVRD